MSRTPGPWVVRDEDEIASGDVMVTRPYGVDVPPGFYIAFVQGIGKEEKLANARLIAAAPELLAACQTALRRYKQFLRGTEYVAEENALATVISPTQGRG